MDDGYRIFGLHTQGRMEQPKLSTKNTKHSIIDAKSLKTGYYSGSESTDFRVATSVAQVNKGNLK